MKTITLGGVNYNVVASKRIQGGRVELTLCRPKGRRYYFAVVYENGAVSEAV